MLIPGHFFDKLVSLNLGGQRISEEGFRVLGESLRANVHLRELFLYNTALSFNGSWYSLLGSRVSRSHLCSFVLAGMVHLIAGLEHNRTVCSLNLGENELTAETVDLLIAFLRRSFVHSNSTEGGGGVGGGV